MLGGAQSVEATDEPVTTTVAGANALLGATTVIGGYAVDDSHIAIQSAFDDGLEGILTGAVSVKVGATASLTVAEFKLLEDAGNMDPTGGKYSIVDTVEAVDAGTIDFAHPQIDQVYAQVDFGATGLDLTGLTSLAANADEIQIGAAQDVALTVEQSGLIWITTGSYKVIDTAAAIEAEVSESSAGVLDGASEVSATDMSPLLTIAEYKQIVDGDTTLGSPYRIGTTSRT